MSGTNIDVVDLSEIDPAMCSIRNRLRGEIPVSTVENMVNSILHRIGPQRQIRRLRIYGHGGPGSQGLGYSSNLHPDFALQLQVGDPTHLIYEQKLEELRGRFAPDGWAELHGCGVAADVGGYLLLRQLAHVWGVPVKAGWQTQHSAPGMEGGVYVAWPDGGVEIRGRMQGDKPEE